MICETRPMGSAPAIRVETTRGGCVETVSEVRAAVVAASGSPLEIYGDLAPFPVRSTVKLLQAVPLIASGAAEATGVTEEELALACSSHGGEDGHARAINAWLERIGLGENDLQCGAVLPMIEELAEAYVMSGGTRSPLRHNCSGKHTAFLTETIFRGADTKAYLDPTGAVQQNALGFVSDRCEVRLGENNIAADGCGAPTLCMSLRSLARGLASTLTSAPGSPEARLLQAMTNNPWLVGGTYRFDTAMIKKTHGRVVSKIGADGLHVALVRDLQLCVAVKSLSGTRVPAQVSLVDLLQRLGALSDDEITSMPTPVVRDDRGIQVGQVRVNL